jgi:hypothetical protein
MVVSKLNPLVNYIESKQIDPEDMGHASTLYEIELLGKDIVIVIGKEKHTFSGKDIIYYPIYLVGVDDKIKSQLGIFEMRPQKLFQVMDADGDLDLEKIGQPLLYSFVTRKYLDKSGSDPVLYHQKLAKAEEEKISEKEKNKLDVEEEVEAEAEDAELEEYEKDPTRLNPHAFKKQEIEFEKSKNDDGIFDIDRAYKHPDSLPEETAKDADRIRDDFVEKQTNHWLSNFTKNPNFSSLDNEGAGDCFFATIRDAFSEIGYKTTVERLRELLAKHMSPDVFENYRSMYVSLNDNMTGIETEIKQIMNANKEYKKRIKSDTIGTAEKKELIGEANALAKKHTDLKKDLETVKENMRLVSFMRNINTFEDFQEYVRTSNYWADEMAIETLERLLNVKFIVLSKDNFTEGDLDGVLRCVIGGNNEDTAFKPRYYIMVEYVDGNHYMLLKYKNRALLKYPEIPYSLRVMVVNKCMERNAGRFGKIPDFLAFQSALGINLSRVSQTEETDDIQMYNELYDPDIVFMFYNKSANAKPGKGNGEKIDAKNVGDYKDLQRIEHWRRMLDDEWSTAIRIEGKQWQSVEHYYQGAKFKKTFPDFYAQFSLDSGSEISKDVDMARGAGGKTGKYEKTQIRPKNVKIDPDFYGERNKKERSLAVEMKFTQNEDLKNMLKMTRNAKLVHFIRGNEPELDMDIMTVRKTL